MTPSLNGAWISEEVYTYAADGNPSKKESKHRTGNLWDKIELYYPGTANKKSLEYYSQYQQGSGYFSDLKQKKLLSFRWQNL